MSDRDYVNDADYKRFITQAMGGEDDPMIAFVFRAAVRTAAAVVLVVALVSLFSH